MNYYFFGGLVLLWFILPLYCYYCYAVSEEYGVISFGDFHRSFMNNLIAMHNDKLSIVNSHFVDLQRFYWPLLVPLLMVELAFTVPLEMIAIMMLYLPNLAIDAFSHLF